MKSPTQYYPLTFAFEEVTTETSKAGFSETQAGLWSCTGPVQENTFHPSRGPSAPWGSLLQTQKHLPMENSMGYSKTIDPHGVWWGKGGKSVWEKSWLNIQRNCHTCLQTPTQGWIGMMNRDGSGWLQGFPSSPPSPAPASRQLSSRGAVIEPLQITACCIKENQSQCQFFC